MAKEKPPGKRNGGNGREDHFARWLAKLIEDAHARTEQLIRELAAQAAAAAERAAERAAEAAAQTQDLIQQEAKATRLLLREIHGDNQDQVGRFHDTHERYLELLGRFHDQSDRHHAENREMMQALRTILERVLRPGEN